MIKNCIVGSGFSAAVTYLLLNKKSEVFAVISNKRLKDLDLKKRNNIVSNKFLSKKILSRGTIKYKVKKGIFHDRNCLGGNSNIWGGHINLKKISKKLITFFKKNGLIFKNLSYKITGSSSDQENIYQIQNKDNNIFRSELVFDKINDYFLNNFKIEKKKIILELVCLKNLKIKKIKVKNLFLCLGSIQLVDLLKRSNYINDKDIISFSEFEHEFKLKYNGNLKLNKKDTLIKYKFSRALGHFLGVQSYKKIFRLFNFIPIYIYQIFYNKKKRYKLILNGQTLKELNNSLERFGDSIHYCDMRINNVPINSILKRISKNIFGFGMSFVLQDKPGPISNDIIVDIANKLKKNELLKI